MQSSNWIDTIRTPFIMAGIILVTAILGSVTIFISFFSKTGNAPHLVARIWAKAVLFISGVKVEVKSVSHVDPTRPYILMANHQGNFDIPVLLGYLPVQFRWLAKAELFKIPIFGRAMRGCGYISIDRSSLKSAFKSLEKAAENVRNGVTVLIFPEGTRSLDGNIRPFKSGGFVLTIDSGVPIVPIVIQGTFSIMPKNRLLIKPGVVTLEILKPVETKNYTRKTKDELREKIRDVMCESFEKGKRVNPFC